MSGALNVLVAGTGTGSAASGTWDASNKSANISLSGNSLIATGGASASLNSAVRSTTSHSTGKYHFQETADVIATNGAAGVVNGSYPFNDSAFVGEDNNGLAYFSNGNVFLNGGVITVLAAYSGTDVVSVEIDATAELIWFAVNSGNWNNDAGADPAAGTGGIDISALGGGVLYAAVICRGNAQQWTAQFSGSMTKALSSGYSVWN